MHHNKRKFGRDIIHRWEGNPVITLEDMPFSCLDILNAGAAKYKDKYILLMRIEDLQGRSMFVKAASKDGFHFEVEDKPCMLPSEENPYKIYEKRGVEDPRITFIDGIYYIMYIANSKFGFRLSLAKTTDFKKIERIAIISEPDTKNGILFPKKINDKYVRLERPSGGKIWISYSDDLIYWGNSLAVLSPRARYWDPDRVGASCPPIETKEGWLVIYYGAKETASGPLYRLGACILDLKDPTKVLGRSAIPILAPREYYERVGDIGNTVFSCGAILEDSGELKLYYGVSNTAICVGTCNINEIIDRCLK